MPLLGQRAERLGERGAARVGSIESSPRLLAVSVPFGLDDVADVEVVEARVVGAERRLIDEELDLARAVAQAQEREPRPSAAR